MIFYFLYASLSLAPGQGLGFCDLIYLFLVSGWEFYGFGYEVRGCCLCATAPILYTKTFFKSAISVHKYCTTHVGDVVLDVPWLFARRTIRYPHNVFRMACLHKSVTKPKLWRSQKRDVEGAVPYNYAMVCLPQNCWVPLPQLFLYTLLQSSTIYGIIN